MKELHKSCQKEDGTDDQKKGTQLLEVYAIEIQMYTETKNNKKLKVVTTEFFNCFLHLSNDESDTICNFRSIIRIGRFEKYRVRNDSCCSCFVRSLLTQWVGADSFHYETRSNCT